jgi:hypothetical protein
VLVAPATALGIGELFSGYETGIDQRIIQAIAVGEEDSEAVIVIKQYLEDRKTAVNPEAAKRVAYRARYLADGKTATLTTYPKDDAPEVSRISRASGGLMIPVLRKAGQLEFFEYQPRKSVIRRLQLPEEMGSSSRLDKVFALRDGYVAVSSVDASPAVAFHGYDGRKAETLDLGGEVGRVVSVEDVAQFDSGVYLLLVSREPSDHDALSVWVLRFDSQRAADSRVGSRLVRESAFALTSRFVSSTHEVPSAWIAIRKSIMEPPTVKLFALGATPNLVGDFATERLEGEPNLAIAGICDDKYVVAKRLFTDRSVSKEIEFRTIDSAGKAKRAWTAQMVDRGSVVDVSLTPVAGSLLALVNLKQFEETRRKNGWYSWLGYRVDKIDVRQDCE